MQVAISHVQERTDVGVGPDCVASFSLRKDSALMREFGFYKSLVIRLYITQVSLLYGDIQVTKLQVALNCVLVYPVANYLVPGPTHRPEKFFDIPAVVFGDISLAGNPTNDLATVASGGTPTNSVRLNDVHVVTAFGKEESCRDTGEASADDTNIRRLFATQRREVRCVIDSCGVVRTRVRLWFQCDLSF
jgi:hypothetical protein